MAKRIRFIPKGLPRQVHHNGTLPEGVLLAFSVYHPGTGNVHGVRVEEHESGELVVVAPQYAFRVLSRLFGDGDRPAKERVAAAIGRMWHLQDDIDREYFEPRP